VERIDLLQFHHPDPAIPVEESWMAMADLVNAGKIRWCGLSNFDVHLLDRCEAIRHVDVVQPELSVVRPAAGRDVIPWARERGAGVLVYSPLASGALSGAYDRERLVALPEDDWRRRDADRIVAAIDELRRVAPEVGVPVAALAVAWALGLDGVSGAICGARRPSQVDGWISAADVRLDPAILRRIGSAAVSVGLDVDRPPEP
jgi:aryl-alcohol dehydrogenase-like predicted oxidoreductase